MASSKPAPKPDVSVLVLGYNNLGYLAECLSSILAQRGAEFEVLYIDNASSDGSADFVKTNFPQVRVVSSPSNTGYAGGNDFGAESALGRYLLIVNPDTVAQADWLSNLVKFADEKKAAGFDVVACSKVLLADRPQIVNSVGLFMSAWGFSGSVGDGESADAYSQELELLAPTGCSFLISREVFENLGGFDKSFFMYDEDLDLGWRAANRGISTWMVPSSIILHKYKPFPGRPFPYYQTARNRLWTVRKNEKGIRKFWLMGACTLFSLALAFGMLLKLRPAVSWAILRGILPGLLTPVQIDEHAGGAGRKKVLGCRATWPIFWKKLGKHSK